MVHDVCVLLLAIDNAEKDFKENNYVTRAWKKEKSTGAVPLRQEAECFRFVFVFFPGNGFGGKVSMSLLSWASLGQSHSDRGGEHVQGGLGAEEGRVHGGHLGREEGVHAEQQALQRRALHLLQHF